MSSHLTQQLGPCRQDGLNSLLQLTPVTSETRRKIISSLWGHHTRSLNPVIDIKDLDPYFRYYTEQSDFFDPGRDTWAKTHSDILEVSTLLQKDFERNEVKEHLRSKLQSDQARNGDQMLDRSIDLTIRLLLMMKVGDFSTYFSAYKALAWEQGLPLRQFVSKAFEPRNVLIHERVKLDRVFTASNLTRIAGMKVVWTENLADHLRVLDEDSEVAIFHHASYLEVVRHSDLFPLGFIDETLQTLCLLFPPTEDTRSWFKKVASAEKVDGRVIRCGHLRAEHRQIDEFKFWRDRLVILKQLFDEREPTTWFQWWHDRRRGLQRYPFLLAAIAFALALFVGIIQCVEGAIQVYRAYH